MDTNRAAWLLACLALAAAPLPAWAGDDGAQWLGDAAGLRPALAEHGLTLTVTDTTEVLANPTGGRQRDAVIEGMGFASLALAGGKDGVPDAFSALVSAWGIYGRGLSANTLGNLNTISNAEADRSLRLFELWAELATPDGRLALRVGQQAMDQEFLVDQYASVFVNAHYGFPDLPSNDLPGGGAAYPFATPAVRLKAQPWSGLTLLAAAFNGDPAPPAGRYGPADPQARDPSGTSFRTDGGVTWAAELQLARNQAPGAAGLPGMLKLGAWYNTNAFADQRLDASGRSLADPAGSFLPLLRRGDWSLYALADQLVWKPPGADGGVGVFLRAMGAPADRNLVDYSVDAGVSAQGLIPGRGGDTVALGLEWAHVGTAASKLDGDTARFTSQPYPVRRWETVLELTYQAALRPYWLLQPDIQYVIRPGGGLPAPADAARRVGDALVLTLRSAVMF